jgi:predicted nucleotidyltransferase
MSLSHAVDEALVVEFLRERVPRLMAVYAFGSLIAGQANDASDLDLAVLVEGYADPVELWKLSGDLATIVGRDVDLLDFRAASTVMQYQIITTGVRWWEADSRAANYESFVLSEMTDLNERNAEIIADIERTGTVYGR